MKTLHMPQNKEGIMMIKEWLKQTNGGFFRTGNTSWVKTGGKTNTIGRVLTGETWEG